MKFLMAKGKLLKRNEVFVATSDPAACDCCIPPCGTSASSGGAGVTVNNYKYPEQEGEVEFFYDAYGIPDAFKVEGGGQVFVDTGSVSGSATIRFCKPAGLKELTVTVSGPNGTAWQYSISCPDNPCNAGLKAEPHPSGLDHEPNPQELAAQAALRNVQLGHNPLP